MRRMIRATYWLKGELHEHATNLYATNRNAGLILMMGVSMSACSGTDEGVSQCPVDTIPIQIVIDQNSQPETTLSAARTSDTYPHFRAFVTSVTEHIAARLAKDKLCIDSANSKERSLLQFVDWPLHNWRDKLPSPVPSPEARHPGVCRISSPWIDLAIGRKPKPWVIGVVRWNQRQLLADQAVLAGARNVPPGVAMPLKQRDFWDFAQDYADSEILRKSAVTPIEQRVPADLLWLFRHSWQSTRAPFPFLAGGASAKAMEKGAEDYTKLVIALIDHCFDAGGAEVQYNSILDVSDLIPLEQYKIDTIR